jgi:hypothetical protein
LRANHTAPQEAQPGRTPRKHPKREVETFAQIPHERGIALYPQHIGDAAWAVLLELDYMAFKGKNPTLLNSARLKKVGVVRNVRARALQSLEAAGVVKVASRGKGKAPLVTYLWRRLQD